MSDRYLGYPSLERVAHDRAHPALKPAYCLRYWYLAQTPGVGQVVSRAALFAAWSLFPSRNPYVALGQGLGLFWTAAEGGYRIATATELAERAGVPLGPWRLRPRETLGLKLKDWHRSLAEDAIAAHQPGPGAPTDPLTYAELSRYTGLSRPTLQRHLRGVARRAQWVRLPDPPAPSSLQRAARQHRQLYIRHLPRPDILGARMGNRYQLPERRELRPGGRRTAAGKLLEGARPQPLPDGTEIWSGPDLTERLDACYTAGVST